MKDEQDLQTSELDQLGVLIRGVRLLREDLAAYRLLLARYMRRGTGAVAALVGVGLLLSALGWQAIATQRKADAVLEQLRRAEEVHLRDVQDHRERNELLHACIVDLIFAVVTTSPEERESLADPCEEAGAVPPAEPEQR